ncbi:MAG: hypothetical protein QOJ40_2892 [Verrucomicrobiota bacterium]
MSFVLTTCANQAKSLGCSRIRHQKHMNANPQMKVRRCDKSLTPLIERNNPQTRDPNMNMKPQIASHPSLLFKGFMINRRNCLSVTFLAGLVLLSSAACGLAASDIHFGPTGSEASVSNPNGTWINMWGPAYKSTTFDAANPPPSGDIAGSVYAKGDWTGDTGGMDNYNMISPGTWWGNVTFDGTAYASIEMDLKYDTNSTMTPTSAAHLQIGLDTGYHLVSITNISFNTASATITDGQWHHLSIPIPASTAGIGSADGVSYYQWNPGGTSGTMNFWMANVVLVARVVPVAPPTIGLPTKATPGLNVFASTEGNSFYDRQEALLRQDTGLSWVGQATAVNPVTYSFTIGGYPNSVNCEAYLFLVPNAAATEEAPDWNETNCALAYIQGNLNNATMRFRYKVNEDNQQAMYSGGSETRGSYTNAPGSWDGVTPNYLESGNLGFVTNTGVLGTWTVKFTSDTNVTLIAPNGNTSSFIFPAYNVGYFAEHSSFQVYLGMQANQADAMNQAVVYSNFAVSNVASPYSENFLADTTLDTVNTWNTSVSHGPAGVLIVPAGLADWISWTLPDSGFGLQASSSLTSPSPWNDLTAGPIIQLFGKRAQLVSSGEMPSANQDFFRLLKRAYSQLQVLLPGEANAPNTVSGKTGTPNPVSLSANSGLVNVTINAVDSTWHVVTVSGDNIHLTTDDATAITPNDAALSNGTLQQTVQFNSQGSWTVTATDTTNTNIPAATSAAVTVGP